MAVEVDVVYEGGLRCRATHGPSSEQLLTDAPVDVGGQGASFSPTDLVATALATCIITTMALLAERRQWNLQGSQVHVTKQMITQPERRIGALPVTVTLPAAISRDLSADDRDLLERVAHTCPVHRSLHPDIDAPIHFVYQAN